MASDLLWRGILLGLAIAAPVGPIGVLCIRRTLTEGRTTGIISGLGAATADVIYGCVAAFGLTFIADVLVGMQFWLRLVGGGFLCYLGIKTFLASPPSWEATNSQSDLARVYVSTLLLTLTNPMTILAFAAIFAGMGIASAPRGYWSAATLVLGVFLGSSLWWVLLSTVVSLLRSKITVRGFRWVNRIFGAMILAFGLMALLTLAQQ